MKINFLILLSILSIVILSCDDGVKFDNPNDEKNKAAIQQGELGGECYPNKTCNEGLTCDKENNTCVEEPKDTNDDEKPNSDDEDSWDSVKDDDDSIDDSDSTDSTPDDGDLIDDSDSNDTTPDEDNDNADNISDNDSLDHNNEVDLETNDQDADDEQEFPVDEDVDSGCVDTCVPIEPECLPAIDSEYTSGLCNGLDDDCDGKVDEDCPCKAGEVQACFSGPRNFKNIGTCKEGVQTCIVTLESEFGTWGDCVGEIKPSADVCDNADNNCNGCTDDKLCCAPAIDCSFDIGVAQPFNDKIIDGTQIYDTSHQFNDAESATWEWTLTKGPCDIVLGTTSFTTKGATTAAGLSGDGTAKASVSGVGLSQFKVKFQLSGNYVLHLKVTRPNGEVYECEWVLKVVSDGLRIELCWDTTGSVDVDLHLGKNGTTSEWATNSGLACYYGNCKFDASSGPNWGYANTQNYDRNGNLRTMRNPRLDIDNIDKVGIPENINVDNPNDNDVFRVGVKYYSGSKVTHPVINVYCGGTLRATYGVEPQVSGFTSSPYFWKVVEIKWVGNYASDQCELTSQWNDGTGYVVSSSVPTYSNW